MSRPRRLVIRTPNGDNMTTPEDGLLTIDLTGIPNANAALAPLMTVVEEQCDLLGWHALTNGQPLPFWDN